jgi:hypothetical protein
MQKNFLNKMGEFIMTPTGIILLIVGIVSCWLYSKNEERINKWIGDKLISVFKLFTSFFNLGLTLLVLGILLWFGLKTIGAVGNIGKYDGQTAEEWFNQYDEEAAANDDLKNCLHDLPTSDYDHTDTFSLTSDIQSCVNQN